MKVIKAPNEAKPEITRPLGTIKSGVELFRFAHDSLEEAIKNDLFFIRLDAPEAKDMVKICNVADGKQLQRDPDHRVVVQSCSLVLHLD